MSRDDALLIQLARASGIETTYENAFGETNEVSLDTLRRLLGAMGYEIGSKRQIMASLETVNREEPAKGRDHDTTSCFTMEDLGQDRLWGLTAQVYGLRGERSFGIGDFSDLEMLVVAAAQRGAALVGINPLHALFFGMPAHRSPYSPSSRQFLNPLYIDPERCPDFKDNAEAAMLIDEPAFQSELQTARDGDLVDYERVTPLKWQLFEAMFLAFKTRELANHSARARAFSAFVEAGGSALQRFARFELLRRQEPGHGWRSWPAALLDPDGPAIERLAAAEPDQITFALYLQWLADEQLGMVQARARASGMPIGLYRDLAVGVDPAGATAWAHQDVVVPGVTIGAPPDPFNARGQNWGLAPFSPRALKEQDYDLLRRDIAANMRHAGAIRIDHVMGLQRLFWIPEGCSPAEGAYVRYPLRDLLAVVASESQKTGCLVIGEDLGTVQPGFRQAVADAGMMSYRLFWFERTQEGAMKPAPDYPKEALVSISTHDLPTLRGFWKGRDLAWRDRLSLHPDQESGEKAWRDRKLDRDRILALLEDFGWVEQLDLEPDDRMASLLLAVHRFLASTPSRLMMVQLEDVLGEIEQANLPGTVDDHPNWRRRLGRPLADLATDPCFASLADAMNESGRRIHVP